MFPGREGGSWLAMNKKGQIGLLTNISTGNPIEGKSRGFLVMDYVQVPGTNPEEYLRQLSLQKDLYSPFNLCLFQLDQMAGTYNTFHYSCSGKHCKLLGNKCFIT